MEFSLKDRLFYINQYKILQKLDKQNEEEYEKNICILENGIEIEYYNRFFLPLKTQIISKEVSEFVEDVLDACYKKNDTFLGFDGNNEIEYWQYADYCVNNQKRWKGLKKTIGLNSHSRMVDYYAIQYGLKVPS